MCSETNDSRAVGDVARAAEVAEALVADLCQVARAIDADGGQQAAASVDVIPNRLDVIRFGTEFPQQATAEVAQGPVQTVGAEAQDALVIRWCRGSG